LFDFTTIPKRRNVVIVEHIPDLARVYSKFFKLAGLRVIATFSSGRELLDYFSNLRDDPINKKFAENSVVLMSDQMPEMGGEEVARKLRLINPRPKIILSTREEPVELELSENCVDGVVHKPFSIEDIFRVMSNFQSSSDYLQGCRIFDDEKEIQKLIDEVMSRAHERICFCGDSLSLSRVAGTKSQIVANSLVRSKGMRIQFLTEITRENLAYCKHLTSGSGVELRHMGGIQLNFSLVDEKHYLETSVVSSDRNSVEELIYSNLESVVGQNQYLFDSLWSKAVPASRIIESLEREDSSRGEATEIISNQASVVQIVCKIIENAELEINGVGTQDRPELIAKISQYSKSLRDTTHREVRARYITEITPKNVILCKELLRKFNVELRHLNGVRSNFAFSERELMSDVSPSHPNVPSNSILYSNVPEFLAQQKQFFESLWVSAVPAEIRIREIEDSPAEEDDEFHREGIERKSTQ